MQLMQFNWFLDRGVLRFDRESGRLAINYDNYHRAVTELLREVLALQDRGDAARRRRLRHPLERLGRGAARPGRAAMRAQQRYRYRLFTYAALD